MNPWFKTSSNTSVRWEGVNSILPPTPSSPFLFTNPKDTSSNSPGLQIEFNVNRVRRMARQLFTAEAHGRILIAGSSNCEFLFHSNPELKVQNPHPPPLFTSLQSHPFWSFKEGWKRDGREEEDSSEKMTFLCLSAFRSFSLLFF
ncbi:hypothetical protein NPIL_262801 [Nephila pilipes]|uniref:Uncharacterized protein n=1 Tax=Nephila pilipes TaxID=299642 RepID=A0A8X6P4Y4_NEPPI|nr:hypothetical protein NPIL_262801 [Nephila pilipes]